MLHLYLFKCTKGEVRFKRLHIKVGLTISISEGKMSFESCLIDVSCDSCFTFENRQAEINLSLCCVTNRNDISDAITTLVLLKNPDPTVKMKFTNCLFSEFLNIIRDPVEMSLRCGFDLHAGAYILTRFHFAPQSSFFIVLLRYPDYLSLWITKNIVPWLNGTLSIICIPTIYNPLISIEISFLNNYEQWWSLGNLLSINRSSWPLHTRSFRAPDSFLNQLVSPTLGGRIGKNIGPCTQPNKI